jgi:hypothetical protein
MDVSSVTSVASQQMLAFLRVQTARYVPAVNAQGDSAIADYKELRTDVESGNVPAAQAALAQLQEIEASSASASTSTPAAEQHSIDTTA